MGYIRKTEDEWQLWQDCGQSFEEVAAERTRKEILARRREYRANQPEFPLKVKKVRVPLSGGKT